MHELRQSAYAADPLEVVVAYPLHVVDEVLAHRPLKEPRVLQDHAEELMHILPLHIRNGDAVYPYASAVYLEETHEQVNHSGLSGTRGTDYRDLLPGVNIGGEVFDYYFVRRIRVAEPYV